MSKLTFRIRNMLDYFHETYFIRILISHTYSENHTNTILTSHGFVILNDLKFFSNWKWSFSSTSHCSKFHYIWILKSSNPSRKWDSLLAFFKFHRLKNEYTINYLFSLIHAVFDSVVMLETNFKKSLKQIMVGKLFSCFLKDADFYDLVNFNF